MNAYATYINAGLRGSRFMGECEVSSSSGTVRLIGRRMPIAQVRFRAFCYVLFVPWALMLLGTIVMVAGHDQGWPIFVAIEAVGFLVIAVGMGVGDVWVAHRGQRDTVEWLPSQATSPQQAFDSTKALTGVADTLAYRYASGKCVVKLRAPIGPRGKLRLVALRCDPGEVESLQRILSGL
jgi:hypothetical protein